MISEPELVGGADFPTGEVLAPEPKTPRPPRPRRPWLWALGGAVVASAVWGGGLFAYDRTRDEGPDLGGYGSVVDLCEKAELKALADALGERSVDGLSEPMKHPALERAGCSLAFGPPESGYSVQIDYTLHKVTDPEPEFGSRFGDGIESTERIDGLGEKANFLRQDNEYAWIAVLDGQAEIEIMINAQYQYDENGEPVQSTRKTDLSGIDVPLSQDVKALMAALKK
ncbi:hypothetical protein [Streptomyces vilmorinianum]|uniref:hypothetical protein n=1 Tax=Streptomyces vilmorinianum TaxID=3051092 RepID=UPI0010FB4301|nr:hypothetical protein [Streptomyces vilmorinianum]